MEKEELADAVVSMFERQRFADWYSNKFDRYITGDLQYETGRTHEECREEIERDVAYFLSFYFQK